MCFVRGHHWQYCHKGSRVASSGPGCAMRSARNKAGLAIKRWAKTLLARRRKVWLLFSFDTYYVVPTHFLQLQLPTADDEFLQYMQHMKSGMSSGIPGIQAEYRAIACSAIRTPGSRQCIWRSHRHTTGHHNFIISVTPITLISLLL